MADHFDKISVKEEQCQEDSFVEDKVHIFETAITVDNDELQRHGKIKQFEESTCLDDIKTELPSFETIDTENYNIKVEEGISADDVKVEVIEFNNGLLYCEHCEEYYVDYCIECGMLVQILNKHASNNADSEALKDIPNDILEIQDRFGHSGIFALRFIPAGVKFGPFTGLNTTECPWEIEGEKFVLDKNKSKYLNWMQYINRTRNISERNLHVFQCEDNMYYQSTRQIQAGDELLVYFDEEYGNSLNKIIRADFATTTNAICNDIFACTFCCLGFSSKAHLAKHKTVCVDHAAGKFSIEELMHCPFCKIHLDMTEYFKHHMAFCSERIARKFILSAPPAKKTTAVLNARKRSLRPMYKCEQCKYSTKYHADLKKHNTQHYQVKLYKCGICNRRFKTKESLRLHVENTLISSGGEHSTTDKKTFKCCVFQAKYKQSESRHNKMKHLRKLNFKCDSCAFETTKEVNLKRHIKTKHLKQFDFKCDFCEFGTNTKINLKNHIKTKHLQEFDYKCDECEFGTNVKGKLEYHVKTKHLKRFDFKCESCEFETNNKRNLRNHIKTKHLKKYDFICDSCEFRTSKKIDLQRHIKTKHLQVFDYKCVECEYGTNVKGKLEYHVKTIHLNQFDFKCDSCEYGTNDKHKLKTHIKTKHLNQFDFKCDYCEFGTNIKNNLKVHIKTQHLKHVDYKCDECEFGTNVKSKLEYHVKNKHLKVFNFMCESCEYRTNCKYSLDRHVQTKHLKELAFKCDECEYRANRKDDFDYHIKTIHLKQFDYKCDECEFVTNRSNNLKRHIRTKHLK